MKERKEVLLDIARHQAENILESWWAEIGSWDGLIEDGVLTIEEFDWIIENIVIDPIRVEIVSG